MRIAVAVKGSEGEVFLRRVARLAPLSSAEEIVLVHVVDTRPRQEMEMARDRFLLRHPLGPERSQDLARAEEERARAGIRYAQEVFIAVGIAPDVLRPMVLHGKPNEEIRRLLDAESIDLVVVGGTGGKPGPHSIGKTARFLIDHAPHAALLVR